MCCRQQPVTGSTSSCPTADNLAIASNLCISNTSATPSNAQLHDVVSDHSWIHQVCLQARLAKSKIQVASDAVEVLP